MRSDWKPGAYIARLDGGAYTARIPFVVRPRVHGSAGRILVQLSIDTWQAYNEYGGKNLYYSYLADNPGRANRVTFHRPYNNTGSNGSGEFFLWESRFLSFLESEGYAYEVCTNVDLHREPGILDAYGVFVSVGHDEYYSKEMYDELERYLNAGGNLAFFSGNTLWWQVRFEDHEHTMVCYKDPLLDPLLGVDNSRVTTNWVAAPVLRSPARLTGLLYRGPTVAGAYQVVSPRNWVFRGVAVDSGQTFGYPMVGYEVDARRPESPPVDVIARAVLPDPKTAAVTHTAEMIYYERTPAYGFPLGRGGKVFAGGTINFAGALGSGYNTEMRVVNQPDSITRAIAINVLDRMTCTLAAPQPASPLDGVSVPEPNVFLQWHSAVAQRAGVPVHYSVFWEGADGHIDSVETPNLSVRVSLRLDTTYHWWVRARSECGATTRSVIASFRTQTPTDTTSPRQKPLLTLRRERDLLAILVAPQSPTDGEIEIFNAAARRVWSSGSRHFDAGTTRIEWTLRNERGAPVPSGLYFVRGLIGVRAAHQKTVILH